jgi:hypothetical protein
MAKHTTADTHQPRLRVSKVVFGGGVPHLVCKVIPRGAAAAWGVLLPAAPLLVDDGLLLLVEDVVFRRRRWRRPAWGGPKVRDVDFFGLHVFVVHAHGRHCQRDQQKEVGLRKKRGYFTHCVEPTRPSKRRNREQKYKKKPVSGGNYAYRHCRVFAARAICSGY